MNRLPSGEGGSLQRSPKAPTATISRKRSRSNGSSSQKSKSKQKYHDPPKLLPTPIVPKRENSCAYRLIQLHNKIKVLLISTLELGLELDRDWTTKFLGANPGGRSGPRHGMNYLERHCEDPSPILQFGHRLGEVSYNEPQYQADSAGTAEVSPEAFLCISVNSGSESDPEDIQGLAHLVEHMVFFGSPKFPGQDKLHALLNEHNGSSNAYTTPGITNYHCEFTSSMEAVEDICARFGWMMTDPLFDEKSIQKEIESVDTEHHTSCMNHWMQLRHLMHKLTIDGKHPMKQFFCGDKSTFIPQGLEKEVSLQRLKQACHRFIAAHYYGANITIVLQAHETLDFLETTADTFFGIIPEDSKYPQDKLLRGEILPYNMKLFNRLYTIKPSQSNNHELVMSWAFHPNLKTDHTKSLQYIIYLISNAQPNGLLRYLRHAGWVVDITHIMENTSKYAINLHFCFELTDAGRACVKHVVEAVFSFLKLHQNLGPQKTIFNELRQLDLFRFNTCRLESSLIGRVEAANDMHTYTPLETFIGPSFLPASFNFKTLSEVLGMLTPSTTLFTIMTWDLAPGSIDLVDEIFGTRYRVEEIPEKFKTGLENVLPFPEFAPLIPENPFACLSQPPFPDPRFVVQKSTLPSAEIKYHPIPSLVSPQLVYLVEIISGQPRSLLSLSQPLLYTWMAMLNLEIQMRNAWHADLGSSVYATTADGVIALVARGFQTGLLEAIIEVIDILESPLDSTKFEMAKEITKNAYFGLAAESSKLAMDYLKKLKCSQHKTYAECFEKLEKLVFQDLVKFVKKYLGETWCFVLCMGWVTRQEDYLLARRVANIRTKPITLNLSNVKCISKVVPKGVRCLRIKSLLDVQKVFAVLNYYEADVPDLNSRLMVQLIALGLERTVYEKLRTEEQLGYTVMASLYNDDLNDKMGIIILVARHMDKHCPCFIDSRIDNFLVNFYESGLLKQLAHDYFPEAPDLPEHADLYYQTYFLPKAQQCAKLTIQVVTCRTDEECFDMSPHTKGTNICKKSKWRPLIHQIGFQNAEIALAGDTAEDDTLSMMDELIKEEYFIGDIAKYHEG